MGLGFVFGDDVGLWGCGGRWMRYWCWCWYWDGEGMGRGGRGEVGLVGAGVVHWKEMFLFRRVNEGKLGMFPFTYYRLGRLIYVFLPRAGSVLPLDSPTPHAKEDR